MACLVITEASICSTSLKLSSSTSDASLIVTRANKRKEYELTNNSGLFITDAEILDFGDINYIVTLELRNEDNALIPIEYLACDGSTEQAASVKLRFMDCEHETTELNEIC